jgi:FtsZ-interacting cell division protein YlmF
MKQHIPIASSFLFLFLIACNNGDKEAPKSESDLDAARNFIRSALDGKFNEAKTFLLNDSTNEQYFDAYQRNYQRIDNDAKRSYRESMINIHNVKQVNDSTTVVIYSNSYKNDHDTLRILKKKDQWLVDFKYLFEHDNDTLNSAKVIKDTLK